MSSTITFLTFVNNVMKRAKLVQGSSGALTSFTDSARQTDVDSIIALTNEVIDLLFTAADLPLEIATADITIVTDTSAYALASDFEEMSGNPVDSTNSQVLTPYPGGWLAFRENQPDITKYTGLPRQWMIRQTDGYLQLDTQPSSTYNGRIYTYAYTKKISLSLITDVFPFSDTVVSNLVPAVAQAYSLDAKERFINPIFMSSLAVAAHFLRQERKTGKYGVVHGGGATFGFPYD